MIPIEPFGDYKICYGFAGLNESSKANINTEYEDFRVSVEKIYSEYDSSFLVLYTAKLTKNFIKNLRDKSNFFSQIYKVDSVNLYIFPNDPATIIIKLNDLKKRKYPGVTEIKR